MSGLYTFIANSHHHWWVSREVKLSYTSVDLQRFPLVNLIPTNPSDKWWILPEETRASLMLLWAFPLSWTKLCELLLTLSYPVQTLCLHHTSDLCPLKLDRLLFCDRSLTNQQRLRHNGRDLRCLRQRSFMTSQFIWLQNSREVKTMTVIICHRPVWLVN